MRYASVVGAALLFVESSVAHAAPPWGPDVPDRWHISGGFSAPVGRTSDYLQGGFAIGGGVTITPRPGSPAALRIDLDYNSHNATTQFLAAGQQATGVHVDAGSGSTWSFTMNGVLYVPIAYGVRGYGIAGIGAYHYYAELRQTAVYGGYFCNPYWYGCYYGLAPGEAIVASYSISKFGWNAGLGVEFATPWGSSWFIEARYHEIQTPHHVEYVPIEIGYRF